MQRSMIMLIDVSEPGRYEIVLVFRDDDADVYINGRREGTYPIEKDNNTVGQSTRIVRA